MELYKCNKCNELKPKDEFVKDKHSKRGVTPDCKTCRNKRFKQWRYDNKHRIKEFNEKSRERRKKYYEERKDYHRDLRFKREFGISLDEYNEISEKQNGVCAICNFTEEERSTRNKNLAVDHCHETNKVRGLLCSNCNRALGLFMDDAELLKKAIDYLGD